MYKIKIPQQKLEIKKKIKVLKTKNIRILCIVDY